MDSPRIIHTIVWVRLCMYVGVHIIHVNIACRKLARSRLRSNSSVLSQGLRADVILLHTVTRDFASIHKYSQQLLTTYVMHIVIFCY